MNTISDILTILVVNAAALLCLIQITDADEVMGKRIWTGKNDDGKRPYFVFIEIYFESQVQEKPTPCGGVLIDTDTVLSAARCFDPYDNLTRVIVNVGDFNSREGRKKEMEAVSVEVYDKMISYKPGSERPPDIARLKLASAAVGKKDVLHSCGPEKFEQLMNKDLLIVGMGEINLLGDKPDVLQSLRILVTDGHMKCAVQPSSHLFDKIDRFCAVGREEAEKILKTEKKVVNFKISSGPCDGDEGGPVIDAFSEQPPCLVGVLNEGTGDKDFDLNTCQYGMLFTSIAHLENWVENKQFTEIFHKKKSSWASLKPLKGIGRKFRKATTKVPK